MTPVELLVEVESAGVMLEIKGGKLAWDAPAGVVGEREVGLLREHKLELVKLLLERVRTPARVAVEMKVEQVPDPVKSEVVPGEVWSVWGGVGVGGVDDDPVLRETCLRAAEACGWPELALPGRVAESVAGGRVAWELFCAVVEVRLVGAVLEVLVEGREGEVKAVSETREFWREAGLSVARLADVSDLDLAG